MTTKSIGVPDLQDSTGSVTGSYACYIHPDGSITCGYRKPEKKGKQEKQYEQDISDIYQVHEWRESDPTAYLGSRDYCLVESKDENARAFEARLASKLDPTQELSQTKKTYGQNGITKLGQRKLKSGLALLERIYGIERLTLVTMTLPSEDYGLDAVDLYHIANNWGLLKKRYFQEVRRLLQRRGAPEYIAEVTELQNKRFKKYGEVAPHLHFVFVGKKDARSLAYYIKPAELRAIWRRCLTNLCGYSKRDVNVKASCNMQQIKSSAVGYLSKYMSKGKDDCDRVKEAGLESCLPKQWWGLHGGLRDLVEDYTHELNQEKSSFALTANEGDEGIEKVRVMSIPYDHEPDENKEVEEDEFIVGRYLKVTAWMYEFLSGIPWDLSYLRGQEAVP